MGGYLNNVKLGTCEDLYYVTYDQLKNWKTSSKDQFLKIDSGYRFRFPFHDEKEMEIGQHEDFDRGYLINIPVNSFEMKHNEIFIRTDSHLHVKNVDPIGFYVNCPIDQEKKYKWSNVEFNAYLITQQKYVTDEHTNENLLHVVLDCPFCKAKARASIKEAKLIVSELLKQSENCNDQTKKNELIYYANEIKKSYNL